MKVYFSILLLCLIHVDLIGQDFLDIQIPSVEQETDQVWQTIHDIRFFETHHYQVRLPEGKLIQELIEKSKATLFSEADYETLFVFMRDSVYDSNAYQNGYQKVVQNEAKLNQMIEELHAFKLKWKPTLYHPYQVALTLYGPGGSYNPDLGKVVLFTTPEGKFKQYQDPTHTIIHEIVHICIESPIVNKYNLPHPLKERIVDLFVKIKFGERLPTYRIQPMGDQRIDAYLASEPDLISLRKIVKRFTKKARTSN